MSKEIDKIHARYEAILGFRLEDRKEYENKELQELREWVENEPVFRLIKPNSTAVELLSVEGFKQLVIAKIKELED